MQLRGKYIINFIIGSIARDTSVDGIWKMIASKLIIFAIYIGDISIYFLN